MEAKMPIEGVSSSNRSDAQRAEAKQQRKEEVQAEQEAERAAERPPETRGDSVDVDA
jgi:hypothetical protein